LTNVYRHSESKTASINMWSSDDKMLTIQVATFQRSVPLPGNSARSIMAESILNGKRHPAYSARSSPSGTVRPGALELQESANLPVGI